eukprot:scaffold192522_cov13-Tisochrysis_lutea.AAC.1
MCVCVRVNRSSPPPRDPLAGQLPKHEELHDHQDRRDRHLHDLWAGTHKESTDVGDDGDDDCGHARTKEVAGT